MDAEKNNMTRRDRLIESYLDGELNRREGDELRKLLGADAELAQELEQYSALEGHLQAMAQEGLPRVDYAAQREDIVAALERKALLRGQAQPRTLLFRRAPVMGALAAAASLLVVASVGLMLFRGGPRPAMLLTPEVAVQVISESPQNMGMAIASVRMQRQDVAEMAEPIQSDWDMPIGTVMVSTGAARDRGTALPMDMFGLD